jgi:peroxidase
VYTVAALRNLLFAGLVGGEIDEIDLIAIDIQRESDVGLGSLNQTRQALGLTPYHSFTDLTDDPVLAGNLKTVYRNVGSVDLFMGGLAETLPSLKMRRAGMPRCRGRLRSTTTWLLETSC